MKTLSKMIASFAVALPLAAAAQTPTPSPDAKKTADVERKQTTDTGQSTTYGQSGKAGMGKPDSAADKDRNKITKGDDAGKTTPTKPLEEGTAAKTPAKEGAQAGPQPK